MKPEHHLINIINRPIDYGCNETVATLKPGGLVYLLAWPSLSVSTYGTFGVN